jgi:hypothetical protein
LGEPIITKGLDAKQMLDLLHHPPSSSPHTLDSRKQMKSF